MKQIKIGGKTLELYSSIEEMPIDKWQAMNEYALIDYEVGSSMSDVMRLFENMDYQLQTKNFDNVVQIRKNMHQTFFNMIERNDNKLLQFACMIHSVNGKVIADMSHDGLKRLLGELNDLTVGDAFENADGLKKKSTRNWSKRFLSALGMQKIWR